MGKRKQTGEGGEPEAPRRIAVCDCETDPFAIGREEIAPFVWGFFDGEHYERFDTTESFVLYLREFDGIVYAHNGGKFDWHFILPHIDGLQELGIINGRIVRAKCGSAELRDSYAILPVGLASWQKEEIDYRIMEREERDKPENRRAILKYLESDCRYLYEMVSAFIAEFGLHLTLAGASMKKWAEIHEMEPPRSTLEFYEDMRQWYFGGRVECFKSGVADCRFRVADINSAYPRAMLERHPLVPEASRLTRNLTPASIDAWIAKRGPGMVFVKVLAVSRGAFPWRGPDNALYFPNDDVPREYFVTGWEYQAAKDTGTADIQRVLEMRTFAKGQTFERYILPFYERRQKAKAEGDKAGDLFSKLMMNANYGKWAASPLDYKHYVNAPSEYAAFMIGLMKEAAGGGLIADDLREKAEASGMAEYCFAGTLGPWALGEKPLDESEMRFYNVATGASITGWVRAYLWRSLCATEGVIYCDTDSIAAEGFGPGVVFGDALGEWKDEGGFDRYAVAGRKLYAFRYAEKFGKKNPGDWKTASKGVRLPAEAIVRVAEGETVKALADRPTFSIHHPPRLVNRNVTKQGRNVREAEAEAKRKAEKCKAKKSSKNA